MSTLTITPTTAHVAVCVLQGVGGASARGVVYVDKTRGLLRVVGRIRNLSPGTHNLSVKILGEDTVIAVVEAAPGDVPVQVDRLINIASITTLLGRSMYVTEADSGTVVATGVVGLACEGQVGEACSAEHRRDVLQRV